MAMKRIHGEPVPLWKELGLQQFPPIECPFTVGDRVIYANGYGAKFDMDIIGFSDKIYFFGDKDAASTDQGRFIHLKRHGRSVDENAWWFPCSLRELILCEQRK